MKTPLMRWRAFPLLTAATVLEKNIQSHLIGECTIFEESRFHFHGYMFISQNLDWTVIKQDDFLQFLLMGAYRCLLVNLNSKCAYWKCFNIHTCHVFCNGAATPHGKNNFRLEFVCCCCCLITNLQPYYFEYYLVQLAFSLKDWGVRIRDIC